MATPLAAEIATARLDKALLDIRKGVEKELTAKLKEVGDKSRDAVRTSTQRPYRTGTLRGSFKTSTRKRGREISLYSLLPQAPVWEWGGSIEPRGVQITFPRTEFVTKEVAARGDQIDEELADAFDSISHRNGFL